MQIDRSTSSLFDTSVKWFDQMLRAHWQSNPTAHVELPNSNIAVCVCGDIFVCGFVSTLFQMSLHLMRFVVNINGPCGISALALEIGRGIEGNATKTENTQRSFSCKQKQHYLVSNDGLPCRLNRQAHNGYLMEFGSKLALLRVM